MPQFSSPGEPFLTHPHPYRPMALSIEIWVRTAPVINCNIFSNIVNHVYINRIQRNSKSVMQLPKQT